MKTHQKLTMVLFSVIIAVVYIIGKNNNQSLHRSDRVTIVKKSAFSIVEREILIDSAAFKRLSPFFKIKKDEFDPNGTLTYVPADSPEKPKGDAIYCYFERINDSVSNLRVRMQIEHKEWLFYKKCQFLVDGKVYEYSPQSIELNVGNPGKVCEWFDEAVNANNIDIIRALSKAREAKVKIIGRHYNKIIVFSKEQFLSINNTLELYSAFRGTI
ncbi:hypothetical protein ACX0HA_08560 [Flavobacterium hauense]